jgi:type VI secretion system protein ImpA
VSQAVPFDIEKFLAPLSAERPAGESLRYEGTYDRIREARREDDPNLPQGAWKTELRKAQWKVVESVAVDAIETKSKDLQLAAWLTEAWLYLYGFGGAARGFELMRALCESFWDDLYPSIENGDLEFRMAPLVWLNEKLSVSLKLLPMTQPDSPGERAYCWTDWENASLLDNAQQRPGAAKASGNSITTAIFQRSSMLTPTPYFRGMLRDLRAMLKAAAQLDSFIDDKAGKQSPGVMRFQAAGEAIAGYLESVLEQRKELGQDIEEPLAPEQTADGYDDDVSHSGASLDNVPLPGRIRDRADAYYLLAEAADFLARTEPHSPTPYLIRRAIAWGSMSLEQLLPEMIRNNTELTEVFRLLQIR